MAFNLDFLKDLVPQGTNIFGAAPSANMKQMAEMGLLGEGKYQDMLDKANKQSLFQGLLASGLSYAAQPKNQGYGSIFPYLAKAGLSGMQAAQSPYDQMGQDAMMNQKLQDMKRARDIQAKQDEFRENFGKPNVFEEVQKGYSPSTAPVAPDATGQSTAPNFGLVPNMETQGRFDKDVMMNEAIKSGTLSFPETLNYMLKQQELKTASDIASRKAPETLKTRVGNEEITSVWNPSTNTFKEISRGSAFAPQAGKATHSNTPVILDNGASVLIPTSFGYSQGTKPIDISTGKPYTGSVTIQGKPLTESQGKNLGYSERMETSNADFEKLVNPDGSLKYSPTFVGTTRSLEGWWGVGDTLSAASNFFSDENDQKAAQSIRDFTNAVLRNESGAAISSTEFQNANKQYFPAVGDKPEVIKQKAQNRKVAIATMKAAAGQDPKAQETLEELGKQIKEGTYNPDANSTNKETTASTQKGIEISIGEIKDGYKFIGGDPNNKNSWQKVGNFTSNDIPQ
ncbi:hypothetical protein N9J50_02010 [Methylophilaceae bacterium]|nr:hypothetical protein [Methylophilaceae bacterium]